MNGPKVDDPKVDDPKVDLRAKTRRSFELKIDSLKDQNWTENTVHFKDRILSSFRTVHFEPDSMKPIH